MFKKNFTVNYASVNEELTMTFPRLLEEIQEASLIHSEGTPYPLSWFIENEKGWIIIAWHIEMDEYPSWTENCTIETWPSAYKRFFTDRSFIIKNEAGKEIGRVVSNWMMLDLKKKRPIRIPDEIVEAYGTISDEPKVEFLDDTDLEQYKKVAEMPYTVSPLDIDNNHHVNNCNYITWIFYTHKITYQPKQIYINYRKECKMGDKVTIELHKTDIDEKGFYAKIINQDGDLCTEMIAK